MRDPIDTPEVAAEGPSGLTSIGSVEPSRLALPADVDAAIDAWFAQHFHGLGPMLDTPLYNVLHAAKEDLRRVLVLAIR
jgi:hypothetical protein